MALVGGSALTAWAEEAGGVDWDEPDDEGSALPLALAPGLAEVPAGPGGAGGVVDSENGAWAVAGAGSVELAFLTGPPDARNDASTTIVMAPAVPATSRRDRRPGRGDSPTSHCHHCLSAPTQLDIGRLPRDPGSLHGMTPKLLVNPDVRAGRVLSVHHQPRNAQTLPATRAKLVFLKGTVRRPIRSVGHALPPPARNIGLADRMTCDLGTRVVTPPASTSVANRGRHQPTHLRRGDPGGLVDRPWLLFSGAAQIRFGAPPISRCARTEGLVP